MAGIQIGVVLSIRGEASITRNNGDVEQLREGSKVFLDDVVTTGKHGTVLISFLDASVFEIGPAFTATLNTDVFDPASHLLASDTTGAGYTVSHIGKVTAIEGDVKVLRADGTTQTLAVGDFLYPDDVVMTAADSHARVEMLDDSLMNIGPDFTAAFNDDLFPSRYPVYLQAGLSEAEMIRAAILAGQDPTEVGKAPAAGTEVTEDAGHSVVVVEDRGRQVTPESGHETTGLNYGFSEMEELLQSQRLVAPTGDDSTVLELLDESLIEHTIAAPPLNFSAGSNDLVSFSFGNLAGITVNTDAIPGADIEWVQVNAATLEGFVDGELALTLVLSGDSIAAGTTGGVTATATLSDGLVHKSGGDNDRILIEGLEVIARDTAGQTASGTLSVVVIDDVPMVNILPEPASVAEDGADISGDWTRDGSADGIAATVVYLDGDDSTTYALDRDITVTNAGGDELGMLRVNTDGSWVFNPSLDVDNDDTYADAFDFTVRVTDADGDVAEDSHNVSVTDGAGPQPPEPDTANLAVREAEITDTGSVSASFTRGSDALVSIAFNGTVGAITGDYADLAIDWVVSGDGQVLSGTVSGEGLASVVLTLAGVDLATGDYTVNVALSDVFAHTAPASGSDSNTFTLTGVEIVASDTDGDSATAYADVTVTDDVPTLSIDAVEPADLLSVDESDLGTDATANFADNFSAAIDFGADGAGSVVYSLGLSSVSVGSGLYAIDGADVVDTDGDGIGQGDEILLSQVGDVITGSVGGEDYFTITVDPASGAVTFNQLQAVWHADTGDHDDVSTLTAALGDLVLTATVTDADGDVVTHDLGLGQGVFSISDDGPTADISAAAEPVTLVVDETRADTDSAVGDANADDELASADTNDIGFATLSAAVLFTDNLSFGADGPAGSNAKDFSLVLAVSDGTSSGLFDTATGEAILLTQVDGEIQGRTATSDELVFRINVDTASGDVSVSQYRAILHNNPLDHDESSSPASMAAGLIELGVTLTDGDGDTHTAPENVELGSLITFEDDGPVIGAAANGVVRDHASDVTDPQPVTITGDLGIAAGADGLGSVAVELAGFVDGCGQSLTSNGHPVTVVSDNNGGLIGSFIDNGTEVVVFTLSVSTEEGTYSFTLHEHLDVFSELHFTLDSSTIAGGPADILYFNTNPSTKMNIDSGEYFGTITGVGGEPLNPSTAGIGVKNNNFNEGDGIIIELDDEAVGGDRDLVSGITLGFKDFTDADLGGITWDAVWIDAFGNEVIDEGNESGTFLFADGEPVDGLLEFSIATDCGYFLDQVTLTASTDTQVKFSSVSLFAATETGTTTLDFDYTATDGDGDTDSGAFSITVSGGGGTNTLTGTSGDDVMAGNALEDILIGLDGDDLMIGDGGDDTLTGGAGSDRFVWQALDTGTDTVTDFNVAEGDVLDLADLLVGEDGLDGAGLADSFLKIGFDSVANATTIEAFSNGDGASASTADQTIVLAGVDLTGLGSDTAGVVNHLLANDNLVID